MKDLGLMKLSKLQRLLLITMDPNTEDMVNKTQAERTAWIYYNYFGCDSSHAWNIYSARASLSRAYRRLEARGYIRWVMGRWELHMTDLERNGFLYARLALMEFIKKTSEKETKLTQETTS
jgi:hypothetical protein